MPLETEKFTTMGGWADSFEPAWRISQNELILFRNGPVYAMPGNANDPDVQRNIQQAKDPNGEGTRGANQPLGWTVPFDHSLDAIDMSVVNDPGLRRLLSDPHELTGRIGGLAFLRALADPQVKRRRGLPDSIVPDAFGATVQLYSPTGNDDTSKVIRLAMAMGAEPVMTSANFSKQPEIIDQSTAERFAARAGGLAIYGQNPEVSENPCRGSYPILGLTAEGLTLERAGCFHAGIVRALLYDVPFWPRSASGQPPRPANYPDRSLHMADLPRDIRRLRGNDLWLGVLATMGWHNELVGIALEINAADI